MVEKRKYLVIGRGNDIALATEILSRGNEVYYFCDGDGVRSGEGFDLFGMHLVDDFYSIIKTEKKKEDWIIIINDWGLGDVVDSLREDGWNVLGTEIPDLSDQFDIIKKSGIDVIDYRNIEGGLPFNSIFKYCALLTSIGFFNGDKFLKPVIRSYRTEEPFGGYISWFNKCPVFDMGLGRMEIVLRQMEYHGVVRLNSIFVPAGSSNEGFPKEDIFAATGVRFGFCTGEDDGKIYPKMINNLDEVMFALAKGDDVEIKLNTKDAYFINVNKDEEIDNYSIRDIWKLERDNSNRFAITYDNVMVDDSGNMRVLPESKNAFQAIGFGNSYMEAVNSFNDLTDILRGEFTFLNEEQLSHGIRDSILFMSGWVDNGDR